MTTALNRRQFISRSASAALVLSAPTTFLGQPMPNRSRMGLVTYVLDNHRNAGKANKNLPDLSDPLVFLEQCHRLGAGGMQFPIGARDKAYAENLRKQAEHYAMHVEAIVSLPKNAAALDRFEKEIVTAQQAGATLARTTMLPGRRYEEFKSLEEFKRACDVGLKSLQLAEPIAVRHRIRLALENHKDHRIAEKLAVLKQLSSESVGLCVDVANNFALLEDPLDTVRAFAPFALTVHIKDLAIQEYSDGFLLADAALGTGFLDLPAIVEILRQARPEVRFNLEVITRDPIKVPVLTPQYRATMPDLPESAVTRAMQIARTRGNPALLPMVSKLPPDQQAALEKGNIEKSLAFARERLGL